jgi:hypothetical protein
VGEMIADMAQVKIEYVVEHLSYQMERALEEAVNSVIPDADFEPLSLFRAFVQAVGYKCSTWETVPDGLVKA